MYGHVCTIVLWYCAEALLQSRPLPHIPALPDGDPPSGSAIQPISQQVNIQQHAGVSSTGLLEAANRLIFIVFILSVATMFINLTILYFH